MITKTSSPPSVITDKPSYVGILSGIVAFLWWGFFPLYWNLVPDVPAFEVLAHRVFWSLGFVLIIVVVTRQHHALWQALCNPRIVALSLISAIVIALNWGLYIWAVTRGYVLQTSLGYFINPLLSVLLGVVVLGEKLSSSQILAVTLAGLGCTSMLFLVGEFPWIALLLSSSFAVYGFMRKVSALGSIVGLVLETLLLAPIALAYLWYCNEHGNLSFAHRDVRTDVVLVCAGFATAIPLLLFAESARRIPLSTVGLLQYIAPSCQFILALFVYKENFTRAHFISFALIWAGLLVFTVGFSSKKVLS
jgi:chloramphenicol-sensitive protein RarD